MIQVFEYHQRDDVEYVLGREESVSDCSSDESVE